MDCSPPGSSVQGIFQARILGLPCPLSGDPPNPGIEPTSLTPLHFQAASLPLVPPGKGEATWIFDLDILVKDRAAEFSGSPDEGYMEGMLRVGEGKTGDERIQGT